MLTPLLVAFYFSSGIKLIAIVVAVEGVGVVVGVGVVIAVVCVAVVWS